MKRFIKILKIFALTLTLSGCLLGISCSDKVRLTDVDLIIASGTPTVYKVGEFDYQGYSIKRTYSDGTTETVPLTEEIIGDVEKMKLWQTGEQTVEFIYEGAKLSFTCSFTRNTFDGIELVDIMDATYDGTPHEVQFKGAIPAGTTITINNGNSLSYVDAGDYVASVTLNKEGYDPKDLTAEVHIKKANYDTSTFAFTDMYYEYDKNPHALEIQGTLPQGVSARYTINGERGNSAVNIGDYRVTVEFTYTNSKNFEPLDSITKTLHITKRNVDTDKVAEDFKAKLETNLFFYNGELKNDTIKQGIDFPKEINTENVKYTFYKEVRENVYEETDEVKLAGNYKIGVVLDLRPEYKAECNLTNNSMEIELSVQKAVFSTAQFVNWTTVFTGEPQSLSFQGKIPEYYPYKPIYHIKPYGADDSEYVEGNSASAVGQYTVKIEFPADDNFMRISSKTATLTINKYYYDLPMPEDKNEQYDGTVYTLQEIVNEVARSVQKTANVTGYGVGDNRFYRETEGEGNPFIENAELDIKIEMFNDKGSRIEHTDGVGVYTIKGSYTAEDYETVEKITTYVITPRVTDFTRPQDATRIYFDGKDHKDFFDLDIPSYVINGGVGFYTRYIYETDQEGVKISNKPVESVVNAGYYMCEYHLNDDHNFIYEQNFDVIDFEIRRIEISSEFFAGLEFTTTVASGGYIIEDAIQTISEEYPLLVYERDYNLEVLDMEFQEVVSIPADSTANYYLRITLKDLKNYVAYEGVNEVNQLAEIFRIIDPKPIDDIEFIPKNAVYYTDSTTNVKNDINQVVYNVVAGYQELAVKYVLYFKPNGEETPTGGLITVGKYYAIVYFEDSKYYTLNGEYKDMQIRLDFEIRSKTYLNEGALGTYTTYNTADNYRGKDFIEWTDTQYNNKYKSLGLNVQSRKLYQHNTDGTTSEVTDLNKALLGGDYYIQYSFTDNPDFVIGGRSINMLFNVDIMIQQLYEVKGSDFNIELTTRGAKDSVYPDIQAKINSILYDKFGNQLVIDEKSEGGGFRMWNPSGVEFMDTEDMVDTGSCRARLTFIGAKNGVFYKRLSSTEYTREDLTFDFTVKINKFKTTLDTLYYTADGWDTDTYQKVYDSIRAVIEEKFGNSDSDPDVKNEINTLGIYDGNNLIQSGGLKGKNFGYYTVYARYTNKYYEDTSVTLVFAPGKKDKVEIGGNRHGDGYFYAEFLIKGSIANDKLSNPSFIGKARQISEYFADEWNRKGLEYENAGWNITGTKIKFTVSTQRLNDYLNWEYGFFTFNDDLKNALLTKGFRCELKSGSYVTDNRNHWVAHNGENVNL